MHASVEELLDLLLPPGCARCGCEARVLRREALCRACWRALHPVAADTCSRCQVRPVPAGGRCGGCEASRDGLDACLAEVWFEADAADWIHRFKYPRPGLRGLDPAARALVTQLVLHAAARVAAPAPDRILPIPLHPRAARRRGYNPAALLARAVARQRGVSWDPVGLRRLRDTPSQTGLSRAERHANVADVFRARRPLPARVWLVDDVVTTGATLLAASLAARQSGARYVAAVCAARTPVGT